jgi:senataxin
LPHNNAGLELKRSAAAGKGNAEDTEQRKAKFERTLRDQKKKFREAKANLDKRERTARTDILQQAHVICCTLSSSGIGAFQEAKIRAEVVIVDEAAQCTETEILIPLQHGCRKLILVGDPNQLRPTVLSSVYGARFRTEFALEDAIGSHACSLEANMRVTNGTPLGSPLLLPLPP